MEWPFHWNDAGTIHSNTFPPIFVSDETICWTWFHFSTSPGWTEPHILAKNSFFLLLEIAHQYWHHLLQDSVFLQFSSWFVFQLLEGWLRKSVKLVFFKRNLQLWILSATKILLVIKNRTGKSYLLQLPMMCLLQRPFIISLCDYDLCLYILNNTEISIAATVISHLGKHVFPKVTEPKGNISAWNVSALAHL